MDKQEMGFKELFPFALALANIGFFGLMFIGAHYFELMGADPMYFDDGTHNNIAYINILTGLFGFEIDPLVQKKISTVYWSLCIGLGLMSTWFTIVFANRKSLHEVEVTEARV